MQQDRASAPQPVLPLPACDAPAGSLFPLRLTPFEYYLWMDDSADYPSVFFIRLECRGELDRGALERAFQLAHARHPLLSTRIECDRSGWPSFQQGEAAPLEWADDARDCSGSATASTSRALLRARVSQQGDAAVLSFAFHHVAVDGMGGFQFIMDLMVAYAHVCAGRDDLPAWRPCSLDASLLADRDGHRLGERRLRFVDLVRIARLGWSLQLHRVAVLSNHGQCPATAEPENATPDFLVHTLSEHETAELSRVARKLAIRMHDLLLRDYFLMLADWNRDTSEARRPIRVLVPTNLRRKREFRMPAANVFGYAFLTRSIGKCQDRVRLLDSIRQEMAHIKQSKAGVYYKAVLGLMCIWPRLLRQSLARKSPFATAVFTNLNAGFDHVPLPWVEGGRAAGDLVVEAGYGAGPIRAETRLSTAVHSYGGRMSVAMLCDKRSFTPQQRRELLQAYLEKLRLTAQSES